MIFFGGPESTLLAGGVGGSKFVNEGVPLGTAILPITVSHRSDELRSKAIYIIPDNGVKISGYSHADKLVNVYYDFISRIKKRYRLENLEIKKESELDYYNLINKLDETITSNIKKQIDIIGNRYKNYYEFIIDECACVLNFAPVLKISHIRDEPYDKIISMFADELELRFDVEYIEPHYDLGTRRIVPPYSSEPTTKTPQLTINRILREIPKTYLASWDTIAQILGKGSPRSAMFSVYNAVVKPP